MDSQGGLCPAEAGHYGVLRLVCLILAMLAGSTAAQAQAILAGNWNPYRTHEDEQDRGPGPDLGDYLGLPINTAGRLFADSWDASRLTLQEHQCRVHVAPYIYHGPLQLRIWEEKDPETQRVIAIKNYISTYEQTRTIWMDGRTPRRLRRTPSWGSRPARGKATCSR
jgi:hypothetical protein